MNYTELSARLTAFLNNEEAEFAANKDVFIKLGERKIYMALDLPLLDKNSSGTMTLDNRFLSIPTDVISVSGMNVVLSDAYYPVRQKAKGFIRDAYPDITATGRPLFYEVYDHNSVQLGPVPDLNYTIELNYRGVPNSIVDDATTWLGDNCEVALLYSALAEGYIFMKGDPDLLDKYEARAQEEIMKIDAKVVKRAFGGNRYESG